jgi:hypothetical protein
MQATAHFETDFMTLMSDAKQASLDALMGETPENWVLISSGPRNIAWFDAMRYVETNFPGCDRRRRKREHRKALKRAYAGQLPKVLVTLDPIDLGNSFQTVTMNGSSPVFLRSGLSTT